MILQSTVLLSDTLHIGTQVFGVIIQTVGVGFPGFATIHDNYQKDIGSFVEIGLSKVFHHALEVVHSALESSL